MEAAFEGIQNPLEAPRLLAEAAADENRGETISSEESNLNTRNASDTEAAHENTVPCAADGRTEHASRTARRSGLQQYEPVSIKLTAAEEPFLLSAIPMIATKDRADLEAEHRCIWSHLQGMTLAVALGQIIVIVEVGEAMMRTVLLGPWLAWRLGKDI